MSSTSPKRSQLDLTNCDREPIQFAGSIQPHGGLLAFDADDLSLQFYSANIAEWLGEIPAVGQGLASIFSDRSRQSLHEVARGVRSIVRPLRLAWRETAERHESGQAPFTAAVHVHQGYLFVELERADEDSDSAHATRSALPLQVNLANQRFQRCASFRELLEEAPAQIRNMTGFDRVMIYRFAEDGHGEVIGEAVGETYESFLGLHYPATDIPQQARRLYVLNTLRGIADIAAEPVMIHPPCNDASSRPLDLSFSCFRAVSPIHVEYLRNMGVGASMSISIVCDGALWGLIACHHYSPKVLSFEERAACEILGVLVANCLKTKETEQLQRERDARRKCYPRILEGIAEYHDLWESLDKIATPLLDMLDANGVAVQTSSRMRMHGSTPAESVLVELTAAIESSERPIGQCWSTNSLREAVSLRHAEELNRTAGCLAIPLVENESSWLMFFRDEHVHEVSWAGEPHKEAHETAQGLRLSPRLSFEEWKQTVKGKSRAWRQVDLEMAHELRSGIVELLSLRAAELDRMNRELAKLNSDLESFAYAASHDLREPLRGLNQSVFLLSEELGAEQSPGVTRRLASLKRLAERMDELIQGLLRLSRAGHGDLEIESISLKEVAQDAAELVFGKPAPAWLDLQISTDLRFFADYLCIRELLTNLISNAVKYNKSDFKRIVIGDRGDRAACERAGPTIYVSDNGIGIAADMQDEVFQIFRRLHLPEEYGGGSGAGLTICRKIVSRHGGRIWIESNAGGGSTFLFTIDQDASQ